MRQRIPRVGVYAAQFDKLDASALQRGTDTAQQAGFFGALAAVMQQHLFSTALGKQLADVVFFALAKDELRGRVESEV